MIHPEPLMPEAMRAMMARNESSVLRAIESGEAIKSVIVRSVMMVMVRTRPVMTVMVRARPVMMVRTRPVRVAMVPAVRPAVRTEGWRRSVRVLAKWEMRIPVLAGKRRRKAMMETRLGRSGRALWGKITSALGMWNLLIRSAK